MGRAEVKCGRWEGEGEGGGESRADCTDLVAARQWKETKAAVDIPL